MRRLLAQPDFRRLWLVGGFANARSWRSARRRGISYGAWLAGRTERLTRPDDDPSDDPTVGVTGQPVGGRVRAPRQPDPVLPEARGPVSAFLLEHLTSPPHDLPEHPVEEGSCG